MRYLLLYDGKKEGLGNYLHYLRLSKREETLYAEFWDADEETYETQELAVSIEEIRRIRDFLNTILED